MGSEARARIALLGLAAATLIAFNQLFGQQEFAGPSLLAIMAATGVAIGGRRLGLSGSVTLVASVLLMLWYLALIFNAPKTFYGLPTADSIQRLGVAIERAYGHSNVDFAPVPLRTGYAILSVAAMWILVAVGEVATFRWRRPFLASLPAIALFSFLLVVGTGEGVGLNVILFLSALFTYWALESAHRLKAWGRWVPVRKGQRVEDASSITSSLARMMGATCVIAALVLPLFLPALEDGLLSWRSEDGVGLLGAGGGDGSSVLASGNIDPLVTLVPQLISQTEVELFKVRTKEPSYWRLLSLSRFDGTKWTDGNARLVVIPPNGLTPLEVSPPQPGRTVDQSFTITGLEGEALPLGGMPLTVTGPQDTDGRLRVDPVSADLELEGGISDGLAYNVQATVPDVTFEDFRDSQPGEVLDPDLVQAPQISPAVDALLRRWIRGAQTPVEQLVAIQDRLRGFDYNLEIDEPVSEDYLEEFLLDTRVGYCQQFATAFALLSRHLGYPTRVVVGFLPGRTDISTPNEYTVSGTDTHAWPEVFFSGLGWVRFEPTPRGEAPVPAYTLEDVAAEAPVFGGARPPFTGSGNGNGRGKQAAQEPRTGPDAEQGPNANRVGPNGREQRPIKGKWQETFGRIAFFVGLGLLLFIAGVPLFKRLRTHRGYARARSPRGMAAAAFAEFEREATELASARARAETATHFARRIASEARLSMPSATRLASIYEAAEYAPEDISPQVAAEAKRLARQLKTKMWQEAGWWRRIKRLWSPAGLLNGAGDGRTRAALPRPLLGRS